MDTWVDAAPMLYTSTLYVVLYVLSMAYKTPAAKFSSTTPSTCAAHGVQEAGWGEQAKGRRRRRGRGVGKQAATRFEQQCFSRHGWSAVPLCTLSTASPGCNVQQLRTDGGAAGAGEAGRILTQSNA
jgi:hypothetical protein